MIHKLAGLYPYHHDCGLLQYFFTPGQNGGVTRVPCAPTPRSATICSSVGRKSGKYTFPANRTTF